LTVSATVAAWFAPVPVPVTLTFASPVAVLATVEIVRAVVAGAEPGVTVAGLKAQVAPVGRPVQLNVICELKPRLLGVTVTVMLVVACPATTVLLVGFVAIAKSGPVTVTV
jgi:hypothetical protein